MAHLPDHQQLRKDLDRIARQTAGALRRAGLRSELVRAGVRSMGLLLVVPGLHALFQLLRLGTGGSPQPTGALPLAAATLAVPGAFVVLACGRQCLRRIKRRRALGVCDAELALQDRLVTADEFLDRSQKTGFMSAALEDAAEHARRARDARLPVMASPPPRIRAWGAVAAVSLFALSLWLGSVQVEGAALGAGARSAARGGDIPRADSGNAGDVERTAPTAETAVRGPTAEQTGSGEIAGSLPGLQQNLEGATAGGGASAAGLSEDPTPAAGSATEGGPPSRGSEREGEAPRPEDGRPRGEEPLGAARTSDESGSARGAGAGGGARDNAMSGDWDSRQQAGAGDDRELEDEAVVRGESEDQDARGGVQPILRDRRPSAGRELQLGLGSDPNPNADGRGGPSEPKKSRGVASMVLGVPIADLIVGQPNPGRTVVTREQIEPDREDAQARPAEPRTPRRAPMGYLPHPELTPWMREMVRSYFLTLRSEGRSEETGGAGRR